jgi:hypothetical protein
MGRPYEHRACATFHLNRSTRLGCACKIQQNYKLLPHRGGFAFGFNTTAKRPLEWNKRSNKPEQAEEQVKEQARRKAPNKTPGGKAPAGRKSRVSIS